MLFVGLAAFPVLVYYFYVTIKSRELIPHFFPALIFKLACGIGMGILYFNYYGAGDTIQYDLAATEVVNTVQPNIKAWFSFLFCSDLSSQREIMPPVMMEHRSFFFIKILSLLYVLTNKSYWVSSLYLSLFSFWGGWYIVSRIIFYWPDLKYPAMISFLYFPTWIFWSSGVLKDTVAYGCIMMLGGIVITGFQKRWSGWKAIGWGLILLWILWSIKYHYAAILMLALAAGITYQFITVVKWIKFRLFWFFLILILTVIGLSRLHPNFHLNSFIEVLQENHEKIIYNSIEKNTVFFMPWGTGLLHFIVNLPVSLFAGIFMPLPWQGAGFLPKLAGIFNIILLILTIIRLNALRFKQLKLNFWLLVLGVYIGIMAMITAYAAPNFGTLERYKAGYLPFFLFLILINNQFFIMGVQKLRKISSIGLS